MANYAWYGALVLHNIYESAEFLYDQSLLQSVLEDRQDLISRVELRIAEVRLGAPASQVVEHPHLREPIGDEVHLPVRVSHPSRPVLRQRDLPVDVELKRVSALELDRRRGVGEHLGAGVKEHTERHQCAAHGHATP